MKLEKSEIDRLTCEPPRRDALFFDDEVKGFGLRVTDKGAKVWLFQYRHRAEGAKRLVLGRYPEMTPHKARQLAARLRAEVLTGGDPVGQRQKAEQAAEEARQAAKRRAEIETFTLKMLVENWDATALRDRRDSYRSEAKRALHHGFQAYLEQPAEALDSRKVQLVLDGIAKQHPPMARRTLAYGRAAFGWAAKRRLVPANPFTTVAAEGREVSRDRVLSDAELGEAWRAAGKLAAMPCTFLRLLILTLQRRGELAGMRWAELAADFSTWTVPAERAKNGRAHLVHMPDLARQTLKALPRRSGSDLVFETYSRKSKGTFAPVSGFSDILEQLVAEIMAERTEIAAETKAPRDETPIDWRLHDFRRTGVTAMARLNVPPHVADRILNHVEGTIRGVAAVYQRHEFLAERQAGMDLWAEHVARSAHPSKTPKDYSLRKPEKKVQPKKLASGLRKQK